MELPALKKQRSVNKTKLTNILKFIREANPNTPLEDFRSRLVRVEKLMEEFTAIENKIFAIDETESADDVYEENYYNAIAGLNTQIRSRTLSVNTILDTSLNATQNVTQNEVKLPKIQIPPFSGDYAEWQSFYDLFCTTIHESTSLNSVQKFQYLKGVLRGEAAVLLRHISITEGNYIGALNKLKERYDRKKHIITSFIRTFIEQPQIHNATAVSIKGLMDTSDEVIRGLKALGENAESRDPWLIFILMKKLDDNSKTLWAQSAADLESPRLSDFLGFLSKRVDTLESLASTSKRILQKPLLKGHIVRTPTSPSLTEPQSKCAMCQNENHSLFQCKKFNELNANQRRDWAKLEQRCYNCLSMKHPIFKCLSRYRCHICRRKHHTLLHGSDTQQVSEANSTHDVPEPVTTLCSQGGQEYSILPTAVINVIDATGRSHKYRALLDSGSQASFVTEACVQQLRLHRRNARLSISGVGHSGAGTTRGIVTLTIMPNMSSKPNSKIEIEALVLPKITSRLPCIEISDTIRNHWRNIQLADPHFDNPGNIDILIGADYFFDLLEEGQIKSNPSQLVLQKTSLGWIVAGKLNKPNHDTVKVLTTVANNSPQIIDIDHTLRKFWELESISSPQDILTPEESLSENHFTSTTKINQDGRFTVSLPFKSSPSNLGQSLNIANARLRSTERRFTRDPQFATLYKAFMLEYENLHHMEEITQDEIEDDGFYLPHHGVLRKGSTTSALGVVFDGSAKTSTGVSLNDSLAVGPTIQETLFSILLRFRENCIAFSADVEKMYRQINIADEDMKYQKIVWRQDSAQPIRHYRLRTVTYGLASAPFLATRTLKEIAVQNQATSSLAAQAIIENMYVDDLMTSADDIAEACQLRDSVISLLSKHGLQLKKWKSNSQPLLSSLSDNHKDTQPKQIDTHTHQSSSSVKVLGVNWNPTTDEITFMSDLTTTQRLSKRVILSEASRLFDPIGWLAPVTISVKIFMQLLWTSNLDWDDAITESQASQWNQIRTQLKNVTQITIPQFIQTWKASTIDMHGFCDASQSAYASVIYYKITNSNNEVFIRLITAKTKVSPIKPPTLPRLELCASVLLTKLITSVKRSTKLKFDNTYAWTDSKIVLDCLSSHPRRWSTFVCNRTAEILNSLNRTHWHHVSSTDNPADCASRGQLPDELRKNDLWWNGPSWLIQPLECWPKQNSNYGNVNEETNKLFAMITLNNDWFNELFLKYSSFRKCQRVFAYIARFLNNARSPKGTRIDGFFLERNELFEAQRQICKVEQFTYYSNEISSLQANRPVTQKSSLLSSNPFLDDYGILRVGGRLENSVASFSTKHPIILHQRSRIADLILQDVHLDNKHAGPTLLLQISRQEYWIPAGKSKAKEIVRKCVICSRFKAQLQEQLMGNLPSSRVQLTRPDLQVGIDYAGPISIHLTRGRGQKVYKAYICLFICLSTKAIHLELVGDMTTESFLGALKRFTARRGIPREIFSDNGSNFIGANNRLREVFQKLIKNSIHISDYSSRFHITWHFIPPSAPHFGGIWEAAIKSTKFHLTRVIGKQILTMEEMNTLLTEIESVLNSRPLCGTNSTDIDALTPSHFLIGHAATKIPEPDISNQKSSHLTRWQMVQQIAQHFWSRWSKEYLTSLQNRTKWKGRKEPIVLNDIVIINERNLPVSQWSLGRVVQVHPRSDGLVRVVTSQTKSGETTRPIHKLCRLPIPNESSVDGSDDIHNTITNHI